MTLSGVHNDLTQLRHPQVMKECGCESLMFSSSAKVYGSSQLLSVDKTHPTGVAITNPHGRSAKFPIEDILKVLCRRQGNGYVPRPRPREVRTRSDIWGDVLVDI